ncbi:hypothetical protein EVAR_42587_1 [Eumeta japonica]|uniref:Uncharacterized protein n=1 Tax=Eumeta variegata TaxID=151549 RepID=A0A4C1ZWQ9_EUMVA|nr:hypothetical protein EVAR_42587_1 [Eumeta japonica]
MAKNKNAEGKKEERGPLKLRIASCAGDSKRQTFPVSHFTDTKTLHNLNRFMNIFDPFFLDSLLKNERTVQHLAIDYDQDHR